jgi:hypothetical protein
MQILCTYSGLFSKISGRYLITIPWKAEESKCRRPVDLCQVVTAVCSENVNWENNILINICTVFLKIVIG